MGKIRISVVVLAALATVALAASPAFAHQFTSTKTETTKGKGFEEIEIPEKPEQPEFDPARMQEFKLGKFRVLCYKAKSKGSISAGTTEVFSTTINYSKCFWYPNATQIHIGAAFSKSGLKVIYHANGFAELLGNGEGEVLEYKNGGPRETAAVIKINSAKACTIAIASQTVPMKAEKNPEEEFTSVTFSNVETENTNLKLFPSGFQKEVVFNNELKAMKFKYIGEETQCFNLEEFEKQVEEEGGGVGVYKGKLIEEVAKGDLTWE